MNYKGIIFDLDGTLLNTIDDLGDSVNLVLEEYGYPEHSIEKYKLFVGNGARNLIVNSLPTHVSEAVIGSVLLRYKQVYQEHFMDKTVPYKGIVDLLITLHSMDMKLAVCSNKHHDATVELVSKLLPANIFDCVYGERVSIPRKPDPASVLDIAQEMSLEPRDIIYVGDSDVDMQTAVNAGMLPVGVIWGFRSAQSLLDNGAKYLLTQPSDLLQPL